MGHILMHSSAFRATLSEDSGVRAGLSLTHDEMLSHLGPDHPLHTELEKDDFLRINASDYEDAVGDLLFALGTTDQPGMPSLGTRLMMLLGDNWQSLIALEDLLKLEGVANYYLWSRGEKSQERENAYQEIRSMTAQKTGVMDALSEAMSLHLAFSPFFTRQIPKANLVDLGKLFQSEELPVDSNCYFDQRFINYLNAHPDKLRDIHWRQFEGLTAEWFQRNGYDVELGPGRNDGGIDVRLWSKDVKPGSPPTIIVQCKREERKIGRVVVKALYADLTHEQAGSGLVVTTSDISPGAQNDIDARSYPITTANRQRVIEWVTAMRLPSAGIVGIFDE